LELEAPRIELTHAERLEEALLHLKDASFDVALLDLSLPDAHGLETVQRMCSSAPHLAVLVLSGLDDEALALRAVQQGAQDYLVKGRIDSHSLVRAVRYAVERKRS